MVHRTKDLNMPPAELYDQKWDTLRNALAVEMDNHEAKTECYRTTTLEALSILYNNKCCICERDRGTELQIDHYRPKKPRDFQTRMEYNQPGYYWLCYEWSNLIPLCSKCNGNKSNKFPLNTWDETNRVSHINVKGLNPFEPYSLDWLQKQELPLMINPEYDKQPERHFAFHTNGRIVGRTDEGKETIKICQLNRKDLVRERLKIRQNYINSIKEALDSYSKHRNKFILMGELSAVFKIIKFNCHIDQAHSYYNLFIYKYYYYFIDSKLPANLRGLTSTYFNQFNDI